MKAVLPLACAVGAFIAFVGGEQVDGLLWLILGLLWLILLELQTRRSGR